jgi:hypothetical protein
LALVLFPAACYSDGGSRRDGRDGGGTVTSQPALITGGVSQSGGARVLFANAPGAVPDIAALTDASGRFTLAAPWAGTYTIEVAAEGFRSQRVSVTVVAGENRELAVELQPAP